MTRCAACSTLRAQVFEAAPQEVRGAQAKRASVEYFLVSAAPPLLPLRARERQTGPWRVGVLWHLYDASAACCGALVYASAQ